MTFLPPASPSCRLYEPEAVGPTSSPRRRLVPLRAGGRRDERQKTESALRRRQRWTGSAPLDYTGRSKKKRYLPQRPPRYSRTSLPRLNKPCISQGRRGRQRTPQLNGLRPGGISCAFHRASIERGRQRESYQACGHKSRKQSGRSHGEG